MSHIIHTLEAMHEPETWVARPGELVRGGQAVSVLATRAGGLPTYPAGSEAPPAQLTTCQACGKQLALLLQAFAPLSAEQAEGGQPRRFLYVFGCAAEGCGKAAGCFKALRLTVPASCSRSSTVQKQQGESQEPQHQEAQQAQPQGPAAAAAAPADDWGVGGADDWGAADSGGWGTQGAEDAAAAQPDGSHVAAAFDFGDLNAALDAMGSQKSSTAAPKPKKAAPARDGGGGGRAGDAQPVYDASLPSLPAFYLYSEPEARGSGSGGGGNGEGKHLAALMDLYDAEAAAATEAAGGAPAPTSAALAAGVSAPTGGGAGRGEGAEPETWGGEGYEEDAVLAPAGSKRGAVGAAYFKFSKQVARCPDQCARYSYGGTPLWPAAQPPPPPPACPACGGPRTFELQLMAPLIHGFSESAEWLAAEGDSAAAGGTLLLSADSWEWLTLAVYTCARACCTAGGLVEEAVLVANEEC